MWIVYNIEGESSLLFLKKCLTTNKKYVIIYIEKLKGAIEMDAIFYLIIGYIFTMGLTFFGMWVEKNVPDKDDEKDFEIFDKKA